MFGKKPTLKEQQRANDRVLKKAGRDIDKERKELERQEQQIIIDIKKAAKQGNKETCAILAKQLVQVRKTMTRTHAATGKLTSVGAHNRAMGANVALANAMATSTKTMNEMNKLLKPEQLARDVQAFSGAATKMQMTDEMINDTLDDMLTESGDEEEEDAVVQQVLDEIGIETSGKMAAAPVARDRIGEQSRISDTEIRDKLAKLQNLN